MKYLRNTSILILVLFGISLSDEGMWTFDNPPKKQLKDKYGFDITQEWLVYIWVYKSIGLWICLHLKLILTNKYLII
jgi:hypothetical protein